MTVCEMLHCSKSELKERCKGADYILAVAYLNEKARREQDAMARTEAQQSVRMGK